MNSGQPRVVAASAGQIVTSPQTLPFDVSPHLWSRTPATAAQLVHSSTAKSCPSLVHGSNGAWLENCAHPAVLATCVFRPWLVMSKTRIAAHTNHSAGITLTRGPRIVPALGPCAASYPNPTPESRQSPHDSSQNRCATSNTRIPRALCPEGAAAPQPSDCFTITDAIPAGNQTTPAGTIGGTAPPPAKDTRELGPRAIGARWAQHALPIGKNYSIAHDRCMRSAEGLRPWPDRAGPTVALQDLVPVCLSAWGRSNRK